MALITILIALVLERFLGSLEELRRFDWLFAMAGWLRARLPGSRSGLFSALLSLLLPVAAVALAAHFLHRLWPPLGFLFSVLVLVYCIGPRDLEAEVEAFLDARERGDEESAGWHAAELIGELPPPGEQALTHAVLEATLVEAHERLLGVLFWFVLLGPAGAVAYRVATLLPADERFEGDHLWMAERLHVLLAWLPVRLCAIGYAFSGSFVEAMHAWREESDRWEKHTRGVLVASGLGALRYEPADEAFGEPDLGEENLYVREGLALVRRTMMVWLAVLALLTITGWTA